MMVQGVSRQVMVVRSPDPRFFEQAIFIVKEDAFKKGVTADEVLQEARRAADGYLRKNTRWNKLWRRVPGPVYAAAGRLCAPSPSCLHRASGFWKYWYKTGKDVGRWYRAYPGRSLW